MIKSSAIPLFPNNPEDEDHQTVKAFTFDFAKIFATCQPPICEDGGRL